MNRDQIAIRITQLQDLHALYNNVLMEAKKLYTPANPSEQINASSGVVEITQAAMTAIQNEITKLRMQIQKP